MNVNPDTLKMLQEMEKYCISLATFGSNNAYEEYEESRLRFLSIPELAKNAPDWLLEYRSGSVFWTFIKGKASSYAGRRSYLAGEFTACEERLRASLSGPTGPAIDLLLQHPHSDNIRLAWEKSLQRKEQDPEGAITSARSMLESACKYILGELNIVPDESGNLSRLYKQVANEMSLGPHQHQEQIFKQILSGCGTTIDGFASLRNSLGDSHGKKASSVRPSARHAELAINLSGALSTFILRTYDERHRNDA